MNMTVENYFDAYADSKTQTLMLSAIKTKFTCQKVNEQFTPDFLFISGQGYS